MTTREKMIQFRESRQIPIDVMARKCNISTYLLEILEAGAVTTPKLVEQIAKQYKLSKLEAEELMPEHLRPHGNDYDPDRYVEQPKIRNSFYEYFGIGCGMTVYQAPTKEPKVKRNKEILKEYETGGTSYNKLAAKYHLSESAIGRIIKRTRKQRELAEQRRRFAENDG